MIHATAIVDPSARVGSNVEIGAYSVIGAELIRRLIERESHPLARLLSFERLG